MDASNWLDVLQLAAQNIYKIVSETRLSNMGLDNLEFKHLLDEAAQHALISTLLEQRVSTQLISEEGNYIVGDGGSTVIADPIDGTTNLSRGIYPAVTCLSVSENCMFSGTIAALIKNLYTGETYIAEKNGGAKLNGHTIRVAKPRQLRYALISIDISKTPKIDRVSQLLNTCRYIRMFGSSANELSLIASGNLDAHLDIRGTLRATDAAAALTILTEAGGTYAINNFMEGDFPLFKETTMELVAASNKLLLNELLTLTNPNPTP